MASRRGNSPRFGNLGSEEEAAALEAHLKRQAIHIVSHLPDDVDQARRVLEYARSIVDDFLGRELVNHGDSPHGPPIHPINLKIVS